MNPLYRPEILSLASIALMALGLSANATRVDAAVLATGVFQSKEAGITASGNFEIRESDGKFTLVVQNDFQVSEGPDLFFAFNPLPAAQVTGANAKTMALKIDPQLAKLSGSQTVDLPAGFEVDKYASLIIHCWKYNHLYAAGVIKLQAATALAPGRPSRSGTEAGKADVHRDGNRFWALDGTPDARRHDINGRMEKPSR